MTENNFQLRVEGPDSEKTAQALSDFLEKEFDYRPNLLSKKQSQLDEADQTKVDPVAIGALILALPGAILATVDLIERMKKKKKIDRLIEFTQQKAKANPGINISIVTPKGISIRLDVAESSQILDAFS